MLTDAPSTVGDVYAETSLAVAVAPAADEPSVEVDAVAFAVTLEKVKVWFEFVAVAALLITNVVVFVID